MAGWLLIGPRGSRRIAWLQRALHEQGSMPARVLDYEALLEDPARLPAALAQASDSIVKLESPGEAPELHHALVRRGWQLLGGPGHAPEPAAHGELAYQQFWYAGFADLLAALPNGPRYLNSPADLACMSDKLTCQQHLIGTGVVTPPLFGAISGYEDMCERMRGEDCERVFIKARFGSSGAGVLAYARNREGREFAYGSAELVELEGRSRVFNSLRQRRYERYTQIARLVDLLAAQGAYLERWIPKPAVTGGGGHRYDVRMVALDGQPRQRVARVSAGALTNLHLGNARGRLESWLDADAIARLESATIAAAAAFPRSRMIGFDLIVRGPRNWVLEANGFGDLLPGLHYAGRTTYEDQALLFPPMRSEMAEPMLETALLDMHTIVGSHDVVLITLDTLRFDAAQRCFERGELPVLAPNLPAEGWELRHTPGSFTYSAHSAFFAGFLPTPARPGTHPRLLALEFEGSETIVPETFVFSGRADIVGGFRDLGYRTICIGGVGFFNRRNALGSQLPGLFEESYWQPEFGVTAPDSTARQVALACERLQAAGSARCFLFINISAIHQPNRHYLPGCDADGLDSHCAALRYVDAQLVKLFAALRARGPAFLIICSDHGTAYGEDGFHGHRLAHETVMNVPYAHFVLRP